jgi:ABC-type multidrug transport system fused ATPase/permease subunit
MVSGEGDFTTRSGFVERVLTAVLEDAKENLSGAANQAKLEIEKIKNLELEISTFDKMCTITGALSDEISYLDRWVMNNFTTISEGGAFDMRISLEKFPEKYDGFYEVEKKFRRLIQDDLRNLLKKYKDKSALEKLDLHYAQKISNMILDGIPILVGIGIFILGLIYSISQYRQESITEQYYTIIGVLIVPFIFCVILTLITRSIKYFQTKFYDSSIQNLDLAYGNYNSEINREIARLDRETIYEPSKDVASLLPKWCIGMTDRPLFNYNWNAFLNNNELCEPHFNFPSMVWR